MNSKTKMNSYFLVLSLLGYLIFCSQLISKTSAQNQLIEDDELLISDGDFPLKLGFSTYFGGSHYDEGQGIVVDASGNCYICGYTSSPNFPTLNAFDDSYNESYDVFVSKISSNGSLLWSTYLGGSGGDSGYSIAIDFAGNCYVVGDTGSTNFTTLNAYDNIYNGGSKDVFISKFNSNGTLLWSTYLGGNVYDYGKSVVVDSLGDCYITGYTNSTNFPTLHSYCGTFGGGLYDVFVAKFESTGSLLWSTYLGGSENDQGFGIAVDADNICYVTGLTRSSNFPTLNPYDDYLVNSGSSLAFILKFSTSGNLLWSTYFGGSGSDSGNGITIDKNRDCYITGYTSSTDFPTLNACNNTFNGWMDCFASKFSSDGNLLWSTYLGGSNEDYGYSIAVDTKGNCFVTGYTCSSDFLTFKAFDESYNLFEDGFVTKYSSDGDLIWSTLIGGSKDDKSYGIAINTEGNCYIVGLVCSENFPVSNAYDTSFNGGWRDAFVTKFVEFVENENTVKLNQPTLYILFSSFTVLVIIRIHLRKSFQKNFRRIKNTWDSHFF
ncbi:MAG: SBBP repeat-containing protein [Candidatus Heimdallarchaeota archaeon]